MSIPHPLEIPDNVVSLPREERIQLAVTAIRESGNKPNGDPYYSARQAARDFDISRASLGRRLQGIVVLYAILNC
jgi:hypothetical protein